MGKRAAFFYGTLMSPQILHRVIRPQQPYTSTALSHLTFTPARLRNYCRHKVRYADFPGIYPSEKHEVRGTYVEGMDDHDVRKLDIFEGERSLFRRIWVTIELLEVGDSGENERTEKAAETYIYINPKDLEDEEWEYELFCKEKIKNWLGVGVRHEAYDEIDEANGLEVGGEIDGDELLDPTRGRRPEGGISRRLLPREEEAEGSREREKVEEMVRSAV